MTSRATTRVLVGLLVALLPALMGVERPKGLGDVVDVRTWSYEEYTRVVVETSRPFDLAEEGMIQLAADRRARRPDRLYVDLEGVWVGRRYVEGIDIGDGLLEGVRLGQNTLRNTRLVIDLARYESHRMFTLSRPDRLVVDVYGPRKRATRGDRDRAGPLRLSVESRPIRTVVLDPGHGGKDPGAQGLGGLVEKDFNLRLARMLRRELEKRGFEVVLTREDDRYIDLEERTVIAEAVKGDVFISLHANASRKSRLRGFEIYTLNENHERHTLDVAARENGINRGEVDILQRTLAHLRVSEAGGYSSHLARLVHGEVIAGFKKKKLGVPDLGVKKGPFYVLFMSSMPSILVEAAFVTNRSDARQLKSDAFVRLMAERIARGVEAYRGESTQLTARAQGEESLPPVGAR